MRATHALALLALLLAIPVAAAPGLLPGSAGVDDDEPDSVSFRGAIADVEDDGTILVKARIGRKTRTIRLVGAIEDVFLHDVSDLQGVEAGKRVMVLGRRQEKTSGYGKGESLPPQIVQISTVVEGPMSPPPLTEEQQKARLQWIRGTLAREGPKFLLDATNMQVGPDRVVLRVKPGTRKDLAKRQQVFLSGRLLPARDEDGEKDEELPEFRAEFVHVLSRKYPAKEYQKLLETTTRGSE